MKLGLAAARRTADVGSWIAHVQEAERLGYDVVFSAEIYGTDAFTPLAWLGAHTERIKLCTSVVQVSARTPTSCAMHAMTLDDLSGGRLILGLGVSGPQVVEGWYGTPFAAPLARTREYISILRSVVAREAPVTNRGPHYPLPFTGDGSTGLGKPLKSMAHPLRPHIPILLGAEGPKNVALCAELCDGWLPIYCGARHVDVWRSWLEDGWQRRGGKPDGFEIMGGSITITDDVEGEIERRKPNIAFYIGGMGAPELNFHKNAFERLGYAREAQEIQQLFLEGKRDRAVRAVTDQMVLDQGIIGPPEKVRDELAEWDAAGYTVMRVDATSIAELRRAAEVVLAA